MNEKDQLRHKLLEEKFKGSHGYMHFTEYIFKYMDNGEECLMRDGNRFLEGKRNFSVNDKGIFYVDDNDINGIKCHYHSFSLEKEDAKIQIHHDV